MIRLAPELLVKPTRWTVRRHLSPLWERCTLALPIWDAGSRWAEDVAGAGLHAQLGTDLDPTTGWVGSPYGFALRFSGASGNSRLVIPDPPTNLLDGTTALSVEVLFKATSVGGTQGLVGKYNPASGRRSWRLYLTGAEVVFQVSNDGEGNESQTTVGASVAAGAWNQVVVTFNAGAFAAYLNGKALSTDGDFSTHLSIFGGTEEVRIGNRSDSSPLIGDIASVRVWVGRALSAHEARVLYERPWAMYDPLPLLVPLAVEHSGGAAAGPWLFAGSVPAGVEERLLSGLPNGVSFDVQVRTVDTTGNVSAGNTPVSGTPTAPATHFAGRFAPLRTPPRPGRVRRRLR